MELVTRPDPPVTDIYFVGGICLCDGWAGHELVRIHPCVNVTRPYIRSIIRKSYAIYKCR
jgi:hypothetical protein